MICIAKNSKTKINNDTIDVLDLIMPEQHEHYTITAFERDQYEVLWSRVQQY
jgi:hypothetical protein